MLNLGSMRMNVQVEDAYFMLVPMIIPIMIPY